MSLIDICGCFPKEFFFVVEMRRVLNEAENCFLILHIYICIQALNMRFKAKLCQLEILTIMSGVLGGAAD